MNVKRFSIATLQGSFAVSIKSPNSYSLSSDIFIYRLELFTKLDNEAYTGMLPGAWFVAFNRLGPTWTFSVEKWRQACYLLI